MIGISNFAKINSVQFKGQASASEAVDKSAKIEDRMNKLFGVSLDEFIKVCDDRKFYNEHGMSKQEYYDSDDYVDSIASF